MGAISQPAAGPAPLVGPRFVGNVRATVGMRVVRVLRVPFIVVGKLLTILGAAALVLAILLVPLLALSDEEPTSTDWITVGAIGGGAVVAIVIGRASVHGRRQLVLFLRKFGYQDASRVTSYAAEKAMGRRWRLVTLDDDSATAPIGVSPGLRRRANLLGFGGVILIVGSLGAIAYWISTDGPGRFISNLADDFARQQEEANPDPSFEEAIGGAIFSALGSGIAAAFLFAFAIVALLVVYTACTDAWLTRRAVKRADRCKTWVMSDPHQVAAVTATIADRARRVHAPRLFIVRSADHVWQAAVSSLAATADAVIVDISRPTENLLWEIRELRRQKNVRWILVCAADAASALQHGGDGPLARSAHEMLTGEQVLVYGTRPGDVASFARSLRNQLARTAR